MKTITSLYDRSRVPLYAQVASVMRQRIDSGFWTQGSKISTLEELEAEFGVARVTIRQAIELLREEGLLDAQQGRGTFVSGKPKHNRWLNIANDFDTMVSLVKDNVIERVYVEENVDAPKISKDEGKLAPEYTFLRSVQYNDGKPFSVVNLFLEQNLFVRDRKKFSHSAALPRLIEMDDIKIVHAHQVLTIGVATPETAELLKIGLGEPTADCQLTLVDANGIAIYIAHIHYHKDCFALRVDLLENKVPKSE
ncbi:GntR family transcriptional regulator [Pseudohoeflea suaedae]|uniref:GntR family transcriptional regulator n=1 Tax=Pseudohoeflea suaedae TaxID=877384 RepID=A0A4R5PJ23_9HYPH|nr:GntR family transcriptional regulator [Pseudohoeflea suaedae]TDH35253.1 GntR family transcriptional regulator [Pseudohoeflea suaedae]